MSNFALLVEKYAEHLVGYHRAIAIWKYYNDKKKKNTTALYALSLFGPEL